MNTIRIMAGLAATAVGLAIGACSSTSTNTTNSNADGGAGTSKTPGAGNGGGAAGGATGGASLCAPSGSAGSSTDPADKACNDCYAAKCDAELTAMLGPNYKTGDMSGGACSDFMSCACSCSKTDIACLSACKESEACTDGSKAAEDCRTSKCAAECPSKTTTPMADAGLGTYGNVADCDKIAPCCANAADQQTKSACDQAVQMKSGAACTAVYTLLKSQGTCS